MRKVLLAIWLLLITSRAEAATIIINFDFEDKIYDLQLANILAAREVESYKKGERRGYKLHYVLGVLYADAGSDKAKGEFLAALKGNPSHVPSMYNLGALYLMEKELDSAIKYFGLAIKNNKSFAPAYTGMATAYNLKKDKERAFEILQDGAKNVPDNAIILHNLSVMILYYYKERYGEAIHNLEKIIKLNPNNDKYRVLLATFYLQEHKFELAINACEEAIRLNKANDTAYLVMMQAYRGMKNYGKAVEVAERLQKVLPYMKEIQEEIVELKELQNESDGLMQNDSVPDAN